MKKEEEAERRVLKAHPEYELELRVFEKGDTLTKTLTLMPNNYEIECTDLFTIGDLVKVKRKYHDGQERRLPGWVWKKVRSKVLRVNEFRKIAKNDYEVQVSDTWVRYQALTLLR